MTYDQVKIKILKIEQLPIYTWPLYNGDFDSRCVKIYQNKSNIFSTVISSHQIKKNHTRCMYINANRLSQYVKHMSAKKNSIFFFFLEKECKSKSIISIYFILTASFFLKMYICNLLICLSCKSIQCNFFHFGCYCSCCCGKLLHLNDVYKYIFATCDYTQIILFLCLSAFLNTSIFFQSKQQVFFCFAFLLFEINSFLSNSN